MIQFAAHIEKLLTAHDHVIVPGLGGFIVQNQAAQVKDNYIIPPHAVISFNPLMKHHDGLLGIEISRANNISYRQATALIDSHVQALMESLQVGRSVYLGRIGILSRSAQANIQFRALELAAFLPQNLGLIPVSLLPQQPEQVNEKKDYVIQISTKGLMRYVAIFITFMALLISPEVNQTTEMQTAAIANLAHINLPEVTILRSISDHGMSHQTSNFKATINYKIIIGVFQSAVNATQFFTEIQSGKYGDYPSSEMFISKNRIHISLESFHDISTAVNEMSFLRSSIPTFADAWVMRTSSHSEE